MAATEMLESLRDRWSEFFGSLRTQISAAFAMGLPVDEARASGEPGGVSKATTNWGRGGQPPAIRRVD